MPFVSLPTAFDLESPFSYGTGVQSSTRGSHNDQTVWTAPEVHDTRPGVGEARDAAGPRLETLTIFYDRPRKIVTSGPPKTLRHLSFSPASPFRRRGVLPNRADTQNACELDRTQWALTNSNIPSNTQVCKVESSTSLTAFSRTSSAKFPYLVGALDSVSIVSTHNCAIPHRRYGEPSAGNHQQDHQRPPVRFRNSQVRIAGTKILDRPIPSSTFLLRSILLPQRAGAVVTIHLPRPRLDRVLYSHHSLLI